MATKRSTSVKRATSKRAFKAKSASSRKKSGGRKSARSDRKIAGIVISDSRRVLPGIARDALNVFKGGVRVALQGLSQRDVAVMIKTPDGPVVGVPVVKNGVFIGIRDSDNTTNRSGSRGPKR